jgi:Flp pilus assembly protein TadG
MVLMQSVFLLPIFALLTFSVIDFGQVYLNKRHLSDIAERTARLIRDRPFLSDENFTEYLNATLPGFLTPQNIFIEAFATPPTQAQVSAINGQSRWREHAAFTTYYVAVSVRKDIEFITPLMKHLLGNSVSLEGSSVVPISFAFEVGWYSGPRTQRPGSVPIWPNDLNAVTTGYYKYSRKTAPGLSTWGAKAPRPEEGGFSAWERRIETTGEDIGLKNIMLRGKVMTFVREYRTTPHPDVAPGDIDYYSPACADPYGPAIGLGHKVIIRAYDGKTEIACLWSAFAAE